MYRAASSSASPVSPPSRGVTSRVVVEGERTQLRSSHRRERVLITGIGGFLGFHLAELLAGRGLSVYGTVHRNTNGLERLRDAATLLPCDIRDGSQVEAAVLRARPTLVFHLAAQSLPTRSWKEPEPTFEVNVFGTLRLLEAIREAGLDPTIVVACSSAEYGFSAADEIPIGETKELRPASPYGISKVAADLLARLYWRTYGMKVIRVRPFFVIGPRKVGDVCSDFARGIAAVERGEQASLKVGDLDPVRDFLDVGDAAKALSLLADRGTPGEVYNLCSGEGHAVQEILDILLSLARVPIPVERDPDRLRPVDEPAVVGDNTRLRALGWTPERALPATLAGILDYWRRRLREPLGAHHVAGPAGHPVGDGAGQHPAG